MNAKQEFLGHIGTRIVKCAIIRIGDIYMDEDVITNLLPVGASSTQSETFLQSIDRNYNNGYGTQELFGTIWYTDGTWSSRGEYDGSEWWEHHKCPDIPKELQQKQYL